MADWNEGDFERPHLDHVWIGADDLQNAFRVAVLFQLPRRDVRSEFAGVNWCAEAVPIVTNSTHVILMRVGDEDAIDHRLTLFQPSDVRQDQIHTRRAIHVWKGHTKVDDNQTLRIFGPIAVDVSVHANFASAAERQVDQARCHAMSLLYL